MVQNINLAKMVKNHKKCLEWLQKFDLGHGDLDMAPNLDPDALVMVPDPKNLVFDPKYQKMSKNPKRNWIAFLF